MTKRQFKKPRSETKVRYGLELGAALQNYFDNPPSKPNGKGFGFRWTPEFFGSKVGVSGAAVRQWLNGTCLPSLNMPSIIQVIFGTETEKFTDEIESLWSLLRRSEGLRDKRTINIKKSVSSESSSTVAVSRRYLEFISGFKPARPVLPVTHTCYGNSVIEILETRKISIATDQNETNSGLSSFFYGLPRYCSELEDGIGQSYQSALFSFMFDYKELGVSSQAMPFDSSAFGLYRSIVGNARLEDFNISGHEDLPPKFVRSFFGNNRGYIEAKIRAGINNDISLLDFHSRSFIEIFEVSLKKAGDSHEIIEVCYNRPLPITKTNLLSIIAPAWASESEELQDFAKDMDAALLYYNFDFDAAIEAKRKIKSAAIEWLEHESLIDG